MKNLSKIGVIKPLFISDIKNALGTLLNKDTIRVNLYVNLALNFFEQRL
jgi:hypothetical protein